MKTHSIAELTGLGQPVALPPSLDAAAVSSAEPQPRVADVDAESRRSSVTPTNRKRVWWTLALAGVILLLAGNLAAVLIVHYRAPAVPSYNSRLADLDTRLSKELARQLHAAGLSFDAAIVNVEAPTCQRAVCLLKNLYRKDDPSVVGEVYAHHSGNGIWWFTATHELAALQFSVNASAEMWRLMASTPPEFPPAALLALNPNQSRLHAGIPFDREIEILLPASAEGARRQWLDLEDGRCLAEPDRHYFSVFNGADLYLDWCQANGLDLSAISYPDQRYLLAPRRMAVVPVAARLWQQAAPEEIVSHPALSSRSHLTHKSFSPADDQTDTYLFRTDQGTVGILRIMEFNPSPPQLKLRYKVAHWASKSDP